MFLIDGYNVLHVMVHGPARGDARDRFLDRLEGFCAAGGYRALVVFDPTGGMPRRSQRGPLEIRVVAEGRTADDEIIDRLRRTDDRTAWTVVTSDREIVSEAERRGFRVVRSGEFVKRLRKAPPDPGEKPAPGDVDYWMREFGLDGGDPSGPGADSGIGQRP